MRTTRSQALVAVTQLLSYIDPEFPREGIADTPERVLKAWEHFWGAGYKTDPSSIFKTFEDGASNYDQMIVETDIPVWSHCEHHMAPFFGYACVGYIPSQIGTMKNRKIIGLSKLARIVDMYSRRLQVQERLTTQIADCIVKHLECDGAGVIIRCRHMCMETRGVRHPGVYTTTSALRGSFAHDPSTKAEFLRFCRP